MRGKRRKEEPEKELEKESEKEEAWLAWVEEREARRGNVLGWVVGGA